MNEKIELELMIQDIRKLVSDLNNMADKIASSFININEADSADSLRTCANKYQKLIPKIERQVDILQKNLDNGGFR